MGIATIIVGGIVLISVFAIIGDYITKTRTGRPSMDPGVVQELRDRIEALESQAQDRDSRIASLEGEVAFTTKLLEDRSGGGR
ncbi:MAG: hypothetical protein CVV47_12705 [Spirochaetae bacterium HGW-Spirochaetae-3]|jgi:hypothetical protein|nr:MAG: hypothetical protein CVV47_12705 [Spirochaetae bacterium HGW-Spirochaetae-3]